MVFKYFLFIIFLTSNVCLALDLPNNALQGSLIIGHDFNADEVIVDGKKIKISKNGYFVIPVDRDQLDQINISLIKKSELYKIHQIKIVEREFQIQEINGLPQNMVTPDEEVLKRIISENKIIKKSKAVNSDYEYFTNDFIQPVNGIITGVFGSQRILNGKAKNPHRGLDIAAEKGTPVLSTNDGVVILAEEDLYYTGGTIVIDHGHGVKSIYAHLNSVEVKVDDKIKRNNVIGTVGSTGRSTGPHLHWGVMVFNTYVDPSLLIN